MNISDEMRYLFDNIISGSGKAELDEEQLRNVTGGMYGDDDGHILETVGTNGTEIIYKGIDTCPICKKKMKTYFYQQGDYFACYRCVTGKPYKN